MNSQLSSPARLASSSTGCGSTDDKRTAEVCGMAAAVNHKTQLNVADDTEPTAKRCNQTQMNDFLNRMKFKEQSPLDVIWAEVLFTNNWAFNGMSNQKLKEFFSKLRPSWEPPSACKVSNELLDTVAEKVE